MGKVRGCVVYTATMTAERLQVLIDSHAATLTLFAKQRCNSAEDVVQVAYCKLMQQPREPVDVVAWLYRVVRNGALDASKAEQRRLRRETTHSQSRPVWFVEQQHDQDQADEAVQALQGLPAEQREVIVLRLWGQLNLEQIAVACGCSTSTVHRRYEAGLQELRQRLGAPCQTRWKPDSGS